MPASAQSSTTVSVTAGEVISKTVSNAGETALPKDVAGVWVDGNHVIASLAELFEEQNAEILCLA